jgi:Methylase involved in ubiquinone/menaquinone biosynthesis
MHLDLMNLLVCPGCRGALTVDVERGREDDVESGTLTCGTCTASYPIVQSVPRFVPQENYSSSFGFQWNRFRRTQLDSTTGQPISGQRFFGQSGWSASDMSKGWTLDLGCGAGRFAEIALGTGTRLVAVDYSNAVDACRQNLGPHPRLDVVQADVYHLPFAQRRFDFVYCFGVLQHTPDVHAAFVALAQQIVAGGRIAVDLYPDLALNALWPKYWLRPITRRMQADRLLSLVSRMTTLLWPASLALGRVPGIGRRLRHALPIANYEGILPLNASQLKEWAVLDTFDMLAPAHDHPQSVATLTAWFEEARLSEVEVFRKGLVIGRGRQPIVPAPAGNG